jgi:hypothetical protein
LKPLPEEVSQKTSLLTSPPWPLFKEKRRMPADLQKEAADNDGFGNDVLQMPKNKKQSSTMRYFSIEIL